jgi:hypothetical protein
MDFQDAVPDRRPTAPECQQRQKESDRVAGEAQT